MMIINEELDIILNDELDSIIRDSDCAIGRTMESSGGFETVFCMDNAVCEQTFYIKHNGNEISFLDNLMSNLECFDSVGLVKDAIDAEKANDLDDVEWYVDQAREIEENCADLIQSLLEYKENNYD